MVEINIPKDFMTLLQNKNILLMGMVIAIILQKLLREKLESLEELSDEEITKVLQIDDEVKESILKHYVDSKISTFPND